MKFVKWKNLIITCSVCLLPILLGMAFWDALPDRVAVHFNVNNEPDNFASKGFAVFGIPAIMAIMQIVCCVISDVTAHKYGEFKKMERLSKWILPVITIVLQTAMLGYALGWNIDMRKTAAMIVGCLFLVTGSFLPGLDYIKNYDIDKKKAKKINRFAGFGMIIMGILMLITIFLPPITTLAWIFLLMVFTVISIVYGIKIGHKK